MTLFFSVLLFLATVPYRLASFNLCGQRSSGVFDTSPAYCSYRALLPPFWFVCSSIVRLRSSVAFHVGCFNPNPQGVPLEKVPFNPSQTFLIFFCRPVHRFGVLCRKMGHRRRTASAAGWGICPASTSSESTPPGSARA